MILKYTLRLIKSTFNRFIAILAIVFIGVSFMMGLRSNYNIMHNSVEEYFDNGKLYDIQIYSTFGFDDNDVKALKNLDYIEDVYPSRTRDVYSRSGEDVDVVTRVLELESNLNSIELKEGRLPEKENECVMISSYSQNGINIGSKLTLYMEDEEASDNFKNLTYEVVGIVKSVENMTETLSQSNLDSKDLGSIIYIPNSNFIFDYYTSMYLSVEGARDLSSFSDEYKNYIDEKITLLEDFSKDQSQALRNSVIDEATAKINEGKEELEEQKAKYQKEIDDGKAKLDAAKRDLDAAKKEIEDGEAAIPEAEQELIDGQAQIDQGYATLKQEEANLNNSIASIESSGYTLSQLDKTITDTYNQYISVKNNNNELNAKKSEIQSGLDSAQDVINSCQEKYGCSSSSDCERKIQTTNPETDEGKEQIAELEAAIDAFDFIKNNQGKISYYDRQISANNLVLNAYDSTVVNTIKEATQGVTDPQVASIINGIDGTESAYSAVKNLINKINSGKAEISNYYKQLEDSKNKIAEGYKELEAGKKKLEEGKVEYEKGLVEYQKGLKEYQDGVKEFELKIQDAQDQIDDAEEKIKDLQTAEWIILKRYDTNYSFYMYSNTCEQMKSIGDVIPLLFFVVAALVCSTTMTRLIDEQRGQIGIYSALGFSKKEIISIYILYVVLASLIASIVAVFVGILIFPTIIYNTWRLLYDLPPILLSLPLANLILCVSCFTVLMMVVTYIVIHSTLKDCSAQLLRPKAPKNAKQILLEKFKWLWNKLSFTTKVTARNLFRYKGRFFMTVVGIAGCTGLLLLGFGVKDSVNGVIGLQYEEIFNYNYTVSLGNDRHIDQVLEDISLDETNTSYAPFMQYMAPVIANGEDSSLNIYVISKDDLNKIFGLTYENGEVANLSDDGVLVDIKYAKNNNINIGDTITLESNEGIQKDVVVSGTVNNYVSHVVYISDNYYKNMFNEGVEYNNIGICNITEAKSLFNLQTKYRDVINVSDFSKSIVRFSDMFEALNLIIVVIILVAGALAFVVLINLTNVNISERIREIATLKVLGFREGEVDSYIFKEVLLMSTIGSIVGLPLGRIIIGYVMDVIDMDMCTFPHIAHPISYVYSFIITIIFTIIVLFITRKTLRKVEMVESLKSIE